MNNVTYHESLKEAKKLLKSFGVLKDVGILDNNFSSELRKVSKSKNIIEVHNYITSNSQYSFLLEDDSIFQFSFKNGELRYSFIQTPYKYIDINQYAELLFDYEFLNDMIEESSVEELHSVLRDDYEQFLETQSISSNFNYIRYDYSDVGYMPMLHSKSHFHIGTNNDLRIPVSKYVSPLKFVKFCLKNTYYKKWKEFFAKISDKREFLRDIKAECILLQSEDWNIDEENEFFIN
ncbi:DUF2290 domain-containing protein [Chryseobacterium cucumeris]|uniref:DUF2290 domain-containing protein n=1 Tax=Chryseobacterium cucumeris TaxID=1813611 RepID=UPI001F4A9E2D|nr:DUF2290 domain-containing protein [Chryseobacterium cucumeris]